MNNKISSRQRFHNREVHDSFGIIAKSGAFIFSENIFLVFLRLNNPVSTKQAIIDKMSGGK